MNNFRLQKIADYIDSDNIVVDVGCDHALLPIHLVKEKGVSKCYACDVNVMPLEVAKNNISLNGLDSFIETILSNGLAEIDVTFDTLVVAGMGGILISEILSNGIEKLQGKKLILQPNNSEQKLREFLKNNGFKIEDEIVVNDNNIYYEIIVCSFIGKYEIVSEADILVGPVLKNLVDNNNIIKQENKINHLKSFYFKVPLEKQMKLKREIELREEILCSLKK